MKKSLGILLGLTILSGCSTLQFWKKDEEKVSGSKHAPALNNAGVSSPEPSPMMASAQPPMPMAPQTPQQMPFVPGGLGNNDFMSDPNVPQPPPIPGEMPQQSQASQSGRRAPQFNPSGDLVASLSTPAVTSMQLPEGNMQLPPPPPVASNLKPMAQQAASNLKPLSPQQVASSGNLKPAAAYPRLVDTPPAPPVPTPVNEDARVAEMKRDLADMQQQQSTYQSSGNSTSVKTLTSGANGLPVVQQQTPRPPMMQNGAPALVAQSPSDPYLQPLITQPVAYNPPPAQGTMDQASVMPKGPTVVVRSKGARPYVPQQMPQPQYASVPVPPPVNLQPIQSQPMNAMPAPMNQPPRMASNNPQAFTRKGNPPRMMDSGQGSQPSTNLAQLHPIAVQPTQTYAANNDSPAEASTNLQGLQPIPTNNVRLLPASRYSSMRTDSRDGSGY